MFIREVNELFMRQSNLDRNIIIIENKVTVISKQTTSKIKNKPMKEKTNPYTPCIIAATAYNCKNNKYYSTRNEKIMFFKSDNGINENATNSD